LKDVYNKECGVNRFVGLGNMRFTPEGGLAVRLLNKTGIASEKGRCVCASTAADHAVELCATNDTDSIGVIYDSGKEDGETVWVVVAGLAQVLLKSNTGSTHGYWVGISDEAGGYAYATEASPPAAPTHFREIGHCVHTHAAEGEGTHVLCMMLIHYN